MPRITIFYHVFLINNWREVVAEQLARIQASGLYSSGLLCDAWVCATGPENERGAFADFIRRRRSQWNCVLHASNRFEYDTLDYAIHHAAMTPANYYVYIHSKGVSYCPDGSIASLDAHNWRRYLEYHTITRWRKAIDVLEHGYDVAGPIWFYDANRRHGFFAGNFWWARGEYLAQFYPLPNGLFEDCDRYGAELLVSGYGPGIYQKRWPAAYCLDRDGSCDEARSACLSIRGLSSRWNCDEARDLLKKEQEKREFLEALKEIPG